MSGCTSGGCVRAGGATICLGLLTFVLDFANSNRMVWGRSGSNLTPCCKKNWCETRVLVLHSWLGQGGKRDVELRNLLFPALIVGQVKLTGGGKGQKVACFGWFARFGRLALLSGLRGCFLCAGSFCRKPLACCRGWLEVEHTVQVVDGQVASLQIGGKETKWLVVCSF